MDYKLLGWIGIVTGSVFVIYFMSSPYKIEVTNYTALFFEVWFGIIIAVIVYHISNKSDKRNQETLMKIENMVKPISKTFEKRKMSIEYRLVSALREILSLTEQVIFYREKWELEFKIDVKQKLQKEIELRTQNIQRIAEKVLDNPDVVSRDYFTIEDIETYKQISDQCKKQPAFNYAKHECQVSNCFILKYAVFA